MEIPGIFTDKGLIGVRLAAWLTNGTMGATRCIKYERRLVVVETRSHRSTGVGFDKMNYRVGLVLLLLVAAVKMWSSGCSARRATLSGERCYWVEALSRMSASDAAACFFTGRLYASLVRDRVFGGSVACSLPSPLPSPLRSVLPPVTLWWNFHWTMPGHRVCPDNTERRPLAPLCAVRCGISNHQQRRVRPTAELVADAITLLLLLL